MLPGFLPALLGRTFRMTLKLAFGLMPNSVNRLVKTLRISTTPRSLDFDIDGFDCVLSFD